MRVLGRRQLSQLTALDLLILILLGSSVETAMVHGSTSLKAGLVSAFALFAVNRLISAAVRRSKRVKRICGIGPILLIHNGRLIEENLYSIGLTPDEILQSLRAREYESIDKIRFATMEADGQINVVA